ncbi:MAG: hypothetical protein NVV83_10325 [Afipia sp.]|nr:hypothetical protein [Afipia sp.]
MKSLSFIEIQIPVCTLRYGETTGEGTCPAVLGVDSAEKCFNTKNTCPVRASYIEDEVTLRFSKPTAYLPVEIDCIPNVQEISFTPATISLGENLGTRATLSVTFFDIKHSDTGEGFDKYLADRDYDPYEQGTFWGKFRARQPFLRGRKIRWIIGLEGQSLEEMETRHFIVESFDGPTPDGKYTLVAKDVLKLVDGDRALAPAASTGFLVAPITSGDTTATLSPSGVGDAEYPIEGYLALGGKEIVAFKRWVYDPNGENDPFTKIMLHFNGSNGGTTFTDSNSGGSAKTWTPTSATTSTVDKKFGTASLLTAAGFISTPDHADFTLGAGDWTVDFWLNSNGTSGLVGITGQLDGSSTAAGSSFYIIRNASQKVVAGVSNGSSFISVTGTTSVNDSTKRHVALVRVGNVLRLFLGGIQEGGDVAFTGSVPNSSAVFAIGRCGAYTTFTDFSGYIDEFRLSVGAPRWTSNFTPPSAEYSVTANQITTGDVLTLTDRGQLGGGVAQAFNAQDRVQIVLKYTSEDVADIIYDLMVNYGSVPSGFITLTDWQTETAAFLGRLYSAVICEPTSVGALVSELIQQAGLCIWWDDVARKVRLQVLRGIVTDAARFTPDNYMSLSTKEQPDKRISQVLTYFGQINPLKQLSDLDNYRSSSLVIDAEAEDDYGGAVIKKILSRWIPALGRTVADRLGVILLSRFRDPPRKLTFDLPRYAGTDVSLGGGYRVASHCFQDETGALVDVPVQITRLNAPADRFKVEAEEVLFAASNDDPNFHPIVIDANTTNVNLRAVHDSIYGTPNADTVVECRILAGVAVTGTSTSIPVFDVGSWPSGVDITMIVEGDVLAPGGDGGTGYIPGSGAGRPGLPGGTALYTRRPINLELPPGCRFWAGGGGGGGGGANDLGKYAGGGGGGAGSPPGHGGNGAFGAASPGTPTNGGLGGAGEPATYNGSPGGDPGLPGTAGLSSTAPGGAAGAAGAVIDGASYVTLTVGGGDSRGSLIN